MRMISKKKVFLALVFSFALVCIYGVFRQSQSPVDVIMRSLAAGEFDDAKESERLSGWTMETSSGPISRSILMSNSQRLIRMGPSALDGLLGWVEHDQIEIRYIASYSIQQILGENLGFPNFADASQIKEEDWVERFRKAIKNGVGSKKSSDDLGVKN